MCLAMEHMNVPFHNAACDVVLFAVCTTELHEDSIVYEQIAVDTLITLHHNYESLFLWICRHSIHHFPRRQGKSEYLICCKFAAYACIAF